MKAISWAVSIFMILIFISLKPWGIANITALLAGVIVMPPIVKLIRNKNNKFSNKIKWIVYIIFFIITLIFMPQTDKKAVSDSNNLANNIISAEDKIENQTEIEDNTKKEENTIELTQTSVETNTPQNADLPTTQEDSYQKNTNSTTQSSSTQPSVKSSLPQNSSSQPSTNSSSSQNSSIQPSTKASSLTSSTSPSNSNNSNGKTIYRTPYGKRYHFDPDCGGKNSYTVTLNDAISAGLTPCQKCAQ